MIGHYKTFSVSMLACRAYLPARYLHFLCQTVDIKYKRNVFFPLFDINDGRLFTMFTVESLTKTSLY